MLRRMARRAARGLLLVLAASFAGFVLLAHVPGEPARSVLAARGIAEPTAAEVAAVRGELGLDRPAPARYVAWAGAAVRGDLGVSWRTGTPVVEALLPRLTRTAALALAAACVAVLLALATAPRAAAAAGGAGDLLFRATTTLLASAPAFVLGLLLARALGAGLGVLPVAGDATAAHYVLPALTLGLLHAAAPARVLRGGLVAELRKPYAVAARARGLAEVDVVDRHALRNAAAPFAALAGLSVRGLLGGAVVVEAVFGFRGLGTLLADAVGARDVPTVAACLAVLALATVLVEVATDAVVAALDPRPSASGDRR